MIFDYSKTGMFFQYEELCIDKLDPGYWERVRAFEMDDPDSSFKFSDRLAKENMWTKEYALRVMDEYKTFMFLCANMKVSITPSVSIDQCWHLHMIYSRDYEAFCEVLGKKIYHGPTRGGKQQSVKFEEQYRHAFNARGTYFHDSNKSDRLFPYDIWTLPNDRWKPCDLRYVDMTKHWVVPTGDPKALFVLLLKELKRKIKWLFYFLSPS